MASLYERRRYTVYKTDDESSVGPGWCVTEKYNTVEVKAPCGTSVEIDVDVLEHLLTAAGQCYAAIRSRGK